MPASFRSSLSATHPHSAAAHSCPSRQPRRSSALAHLAMPVMRSLSRGAARNVPPNPASLERTYPWMKAARRALAIPLWALAYPRSAGARRFGLLWSPVCWTTPSSFVLPLSSAQPCFAPTGARSGEPVSPKLVDRSTLQPQASVTAPEIPASNLQRPTDRCEAPWCPVHLALAAAAYSMHQGRREATCLHPEDPSVLALTAHCWRQHRSERPCSLEGSVNLDSLRQQPRSRDPKHSAQACPPVAAPERPCRCAHLCPTRSPAAAEYFAKAVRLSHHEDPCPLKVPVHPARMKLL